ncbi:MAG: efflux RND transporter periplasmic adaptor subunit [Deltaproteobacteria bacterium]|nr:efflux RND transporter periplasmic adaptor subunit [Deltaproteobacteria bacterium]
MILTRRPDLLVLLLGVVAGFSVVACKQKSGDATPAGSADRAEAEGGASHEERDATVKLTPEQVLTARIALGRVERRAAAGLVEATAQIEPAADREARVGTRIAGRMAALKAGVGDLVKRGALLALVDSPEVGRAKADFLAAVATAKVARESAERERALFEKKISSEKDWREAEAAAVKARAEKEAAENRLHALGITDAELAGMRVEGHYSSTVSVTSPIEGVVVARPVSLGQMVDPTETLFLVIDLREVWILIDVYERDLGQVRVGQNVLVKVAAYPGKEFRGTVQNIGAVVEPRTRAVKVRVVLSNEVGDLKPGMFATVTIEGTTGEEHEHLFAPAAAIQRDGDRNLAFVPRAENEFEPRVVRLGHQAGEWVEVQEGLVEGDSVVTTGSFALKSEMKKGELGEGDEH